MKAHRVVRAEAPISCLDNRLTDGGMVVSPTRRSLFTPRKIFLFKAESTQGHSAAGRIRSIEKFSYLIGNRTRDLLIRSIVPQPTTLPRASPPPIELYIMKRTHNNLNAKNPQYGLPSGCETCSFTLITNNARNYNFIYFNL
jgi:hypothetical protein